MARIVLVHGAFAGAWCWDRVIGPLQDAGHDVEAIDLPGSGSDRTPLHEVSLDAYATRVVETLNASPVPAALVGHSMGGVVITQAASRAAGRIERLVYVCAFLPRDGESLKNLTDTPEGADDRIQANMVVDPETGVAKLSREATIDAVYNRTPDEATRWGLERGRPQSLAPFLSAVDVDQRVLDGLPRAYVLCTDDHAIPPALQRRMIAASPCGAVAELDTDHSPFLSRPAELAAILDRFAHR